VDEKEIIKVLDATVHTELTKGDFSLRWLMRDKDYSWFLFKARLCRGSFGPAESAKQGQWNL
jgi:hypothetical protein